MQHRRTAIDALVERAVDALAKWDDSAGTRRAEIRSIVDQLSRHGDLVESWLDGTLRDLPDDSLGFASFTEMALPARPASASAKQSAGGKQPARSAPRQRRSRPWPPRSPSGRPPRSAPPVPNGSHASARRARTWPRRRAS